MKHQQHPDWLEQTQCMGKHRFADAGLAKKVASQSAKRKEGRVSAYRCIHCGGWHIGNGNGKNSNRRK